jgi:hypothetical protein
VEYFERELEALARDVAQVAASAADPVMSRRLTDMADEVLAIADREAADSAIYHSAILFRHTGRANIDADPHADDRSTRQTQRN